MVDKPERIGALKSGVLEYLDRQIRNDPANPEWFLEKARYYQQTGWPNDALEVLNEAILTDSSLLEAYNLRLLYYLNKGRYKDALKDADHLISRSYVTDDLINNKLTALYGQKQFQEFHNEVLGFGGSLNQLNRRLLARFYMERGDTLLAIRHSYLNYKKFDFEDDELLDLVELLSSEGFINKARAILKQADRDSENVQLARARLDLKSGQESEGLEQLISLAEDGSKDALFDLGIYYQSLNQPDKAIELYNRFLQRQDSSLQVMNQLGNFYQQRYSWSQALRIYREVLKKDPSNEEASRESGKVSGKIAYLRSLNAQGTTESDDN